MDAITLVGLARMYSMQEDHLLATLQNCHHVVVTARETLGEARQFVIMGGKDSACLDVVMNKFHDGLG